MGGHFIPYNDIPDKSGLKWRTTQRWLPRPQFLVDEQVFMVSQYIEFDNVLEANRRFQRQFRNLRTP